MKLPIKHEFFAEIKNGNKRVEYRDAHITFIDEETKEEIRVNVIDVFIARRSQLDARLRPVFSDKKIIGFSLDNK